MTPKQRIDAALELARQGFTRLRDWAEEPDPVAQRRLQVEAASQYRAAADLLDDQGRLRG
jgi:hypothetical protein